MRGQDQSTRRQRAKTAVGVPKRVIVSFPASCKQEVSRGLYELASNRTRHLHRELPYTPIAEVLASAYMQGMADAIDTLDNRGMLR